MAVLHGQSIHDRGQHAHVIGRGPVHALGRYGHAPENVAAADDQTELNAERGRLRQFPADGLDGLGFDTEALLAGQSLSGKFEHDSAVAEFVHNMPPWVNGGENEATRRGRAISISPSGRNKGGCPPLYPRKENGPERPGRY